MPTISQLPVATVVNTGDLFVIVQGGVTKQATDSLVLASIASSIIISESQVTNLVSDLAARLVAANNLSDLTNAMTARTNLGLGSAAVVNVPITAPNGGTGVASPTANTLPLAQGTSNFSFLGPLTNGELLIGHSSNAPVAATLTAGTGITITNGAGSITIAASAAGVTWNNITTSPESLVSDNGYITNDSSAAVTYTLPLSSSQGDIIYIVGRQQGWVVGQNASQQIILGSSATTSGTGGSIQSNNAHDCVTMICTAANLEWTVISVVGIITVI